MRRTFHIVTKVYSYPALVVEFNPDGTLANECNSFASSRQTQGPPFLLLTS